jgi:hypothetical protein
MAYTIDISGFTMFNAWKMVNDLDRYNFISTMEQEFNIKIKNYEVIDDIKWQYTVEFSSEGDATLFLLRFS